MNKKINTRVCRLCEVEKPLNYEYFNKDGKGIMGFTGACKKCLLLKGISDITDELAEYYGGIADKLHNQLYTKQNEPSWSELKKLKL